MNTTVEEIIKTRTFASLQEAEKLSVLELVENEQEFNQMKQFLVEIDTIIPLQKEEPSVEIKNSLDQIFQAKHPGISSNWSAQPAEKRIVPFYQNNWFKVAAIVFITCSVLSIYLTSNSRTESQLAQVKPNDKQTDKQENQTKIENLKENGSSELNNSDENQQKKDVKTIIPETVLIAQITKKKSTATASIASAESIYESDALTRSVASSEVTIESFSSKGMSADLDPRLGSTNQQLAFVKPIDAIDLLEYISPAF